MDLSNEAMVEDAARRAVEVLYPHVPGEPFSHPLQNWFMVNAGRMAGAVSSLVRY